jgi:hypothetical protein
MTPEIQTKLRHFLKGHIPFTEECHAVYLLVEIRKILDRENDNNFPLLRFYADWSVHTEKDKITPQIKTIMEGLLTEIKERQLNGSFVKHDPKLPAFVSMMEMRKQMDTFLQKYQLPDDLISLNNWNSFADGLANILADQPMNDPCEGIREFAFRPAKAGFVIAEIKYEKAPGVFDIFRLTGGN